MESSVRPSEIAWPADWQREAIEAVLPHLGTDERLEILVGDPQRSIHGTLLGGHVYIDDGTPTIIHDRSGRPDVFPWQLLSGPVLRIQLLRPRRPRVVLFAHPDWSPPVSP